MAKRKQRCPSRHERDQAGCIWGLISIFDFRHGRSTRRLLADRKRVGKQTVGAGQPSTQTIVPVPTEKCEDIVDTEESKMAVADVAKTSVKELMEEEMVKEQGSTNQPNDSEMGLEQINSKNGNHMKKNQKRRNRSCIKSTDMDVSELDATGCLMPEKFNHFPEQKPSENLDLEKIMEELVKINQRKTNCLKHDFHGDLDIPSGQAVAVVEEKLIAAVEQLIEQRLSKSKRFGEEGNSCCSNEFMDALQTLSLNKDLFLKLLQDPNSVLAKHIQNLEDAQLNKDQAPSSLPASSSSEEIPVNIKSDELSGRKHRNFFRRRSKSLECYPSGADRDCQSPNKIVLLKPGPAGAQSPDTDSAFSSISLQSPMDNKVHNDKSMSQFSFTEIKRKLRHAIGKERQGISPDRIILQLSPKQQNRSNDKGGIGENFGWSSPNRNHFYTERFNKSSPSFKKGEPVGKPKGKGSDMVNETYQYPRVGGSNIYIEAKKHLSEMLKSGEENVEPMTGQLPKSLGRILSFPEYNGSPCRSPRKLGDDIFVTAQMRLSPRGIVKNNVGGVFQENHNHPSPRRQNLESQPCISSSSSEDKERSWSSNFNIPHSDDEKCSSETQSFHQDTIVPEDKSSSSKAAEIEETTESSPQEEEKIINISSKSSNSSINGDLQKGYTRELDNEENVAEFLKASPCFKSDLHGEDQILSSPTVSPSRSPVSREVQDSDSIIDKMERPSPISVLEPLFTDDDISPGSSVSRPVQNEIEPRHFHFEEQSSSANDQGICLRISLEDEESAFEYVEAVLLGSGLNWDEFLLRWLSLDEILDSSLFDEVELFSSRPRHDQKLLFDSANEALKEVCESYFGCFTGISHVNWNTRPVPKGMDLIQEIWRLVEMHLSQCQQPHSLDQLVKRDLARSGKWMNLQSDIELIGLEIEETIFNELVDTVLDFAGDASECEFGALQAESKAIEETSL
ncbi:uncharacterized protein LOC105172605 [Sesamum indicum]|uniref:Uncharacterized protein LOC105172605 n=1 Tax=Sesamum indicum TaxID=4182 RepID=A0A6I9TYF7_SESIN|nr:uncharacterized protein LOC105172605 [Sesamum indicum]XP_020552112.1 uncharacterized protein LOC105172605 [Sesamum indicum]